MSTMLTLTSPNRTAVFLARIVEDALGDVLVLSERSGLPEHRVDEGRFAVVDVGDDRDVPEVLAGRHEGG